MIHRNRRRHYTYYVILVLRKGKNLGMKKRDPDKKRNRKRLCAIAE
jgi:hypothetical protein